MRPAAQSSPEVDSGLIVVDSAYSVLTLDRGAAAILNYYRHRRWEPIYTIDQQTIDVVHRMSDLASADHVLRIDLEEFICRLYVLDTCDAWVSQPLLALLLERHRRTRIIDEFAAHHHLTEREQQALKGLSMGLSTKVIAATMNIKPSTLRSFLRLIKIKMGAPTTSELMIRLLQSEAAGPPSLPVPFSGSTAPPSVPT